MAKQVINVGAAEDDGTGESLRSGGVKINANFTELYDRTAVLQLIAAENISALRVLASDDLGQVVYADNNSVGQAFKVMGISISTGLLGANVTLQTEGILTDAGWSWAGTGPLFVGTNGVLTQTPPTNGYSVVVGWPTNPTTIFININHAIILL